MLPNALSGLRIACVPIILWSLYRDTANPDTAGVSWLTGVLLLCIVTTDFLDGYSARKFGLVSHTGKILDPLADKIAVGGIGLALVPWFGFPLWLWVLQLTRDIVIIATGTYLYRTRRLVISASPLGKAATVTMVISLSSYAFALPREVAFVSVLVTTALLFLSSFGYARRVLQLATPSEQGDGNGRL